MQRLLTTTAFALVAGFAVTAQAQDSANKQAMSDQACAESWTKADSDKNGKISQAEAKAAADAEFSRIDVDGNGTISVTEWKDCGDRAAYPGVPDALQESPGQESAMGSEGMTESPASDQAETAMENAKSEFVEGEPATTGSISESGEVTNWQQSFDVADIDDSGYLSPDEAAAAAGELNVEQADAEESVQLSSSVFASLDEDADGQLSKEEWSKRGPTVTHAGLDARYGLIDSDGDGEVSQNEWNAYRDDRFSAAQQSAERSSGGDAVPVTIFYYYVW